MPYVKKKAPMRKPKKGGRKNPMRRKSMQLSRASALPFPKIKQVQLLYKQPSQQLDSGVSTGTVTQIFNLNSLFDFDGSNQLGNKNPLYFSQLFSSTGPYRYYKVNAWKTKVTVTNLTGNALHCYYDQGVIGSITEADNYIELQNRPGVIYNFLTAGANAKPQCVIKSYKTTKSFAPKGQSSGIDYGASFNANPLNTIFGTLQVTNLNPTSLTSFSVVINVEHVFYATCYYQDAAI